LLADGFTPGCAVCAPAHAVDSCSSSAPANPPQQRAQSADGTSRRAARKDLNNLPNKRGKRESNTGGGGSAAAVGSFEAGSVYTELCEFQDFRPGPSSAHPPARRRARSARLRSHVGAHGFGGRQSPPPELAPPPPTSYLCKPINYKEDLTPYLAEPAPLLNKPITFGSRLSSSFGRAGKVAAAAKEAAASGAKEGGGPAGIAAQILHEQQLRILSSLYGTPLRVFGVPSPQMGAAEGGVGVVQAPGAKPGTRGPPAGNALAVAMAAKAARGAE
jgi:hypothetical protein